MANQIIFLLTFTVTRMVWAPYILYLGYLDVNVAWNLRSTFQTVCAILSLTEAFCVWLINLFWFYLILQGMIKMLRDAGLLKKVEGKEPSTVEKFEEKTKLTGKK